MTNNDGRLPDGTGLPLQAPTGLGLSAGIPDAVIADICSERVLIACSAAKAVPGDVWGVGAEGHYAFLLGLAALLRIPSETLDWECSHALRAAKGFMERHPETGITMRCPDRILSELGFAQGIEAGTVETERLDRDDDEG